jgi:hypothetical protein
MFTLRESMTSRRIDAQIQATNRFTRSSRPCLPTHFSYCSIGRKSIPSGGKSWLWIRVMICKANRDWGSTMYCNIFSSNILRLRTGSVYAREDGLNPCVLASLRVESVLTYLPALPGECRVPTLGGAGACQAVVGCPHIAATKKICHGWRQLSGRRASASRQRNRQTGRESRDDRSRS